MILNGRLFPPTIEAAASANHGAVLYERYEVYYCNKIQSKQNFIPRLITI